MWIALIHLCCPLLHRAPLAFLPQPPDLVWNTVKSFYIKHWKLLPVVVYWRLLIQSEIVQWNVVSCSPKILSFAIRWLYHKLISLSIILSKNWSEWFLLWGNYSSLVYSVQVLPALCVVMCVKCEWVDGGCRKLISVSVKFHSLWNKKKEKTKTSGNSSKT